MLYYLCDRWALKTPEIPWECHAWNRMNIRPQATGKAGEGPVLLPVEFLHPLLS